MRHVEAALKKYSKNSNLDNVRMRLERLDQSVLASMSPSEIGNLIESIFSSMSHADAVIDQHTAFTQNDRPNEALAHVFPDGFVNEVTKRLAEVPHYQIEAGNDEILCSLTNGRKVRFSPSSLVVTPLKISESV